MKAVDSLPPEIPYGYRSVYVITLMNTGKSYVGSSMNVRARVHQHLRNLLRRAELKQLAVTVCRGVLNGTIFLGTVATALVAADWWNGGLDWSWHDLWQERYAIYTFWLASVLAWLPFSVAFHKSPLMDWVSTQQCRRLREQLLAEARAVASDD